MGMGFSSGRQCPRNLRGLIQLISDIPRQQLLDAIDRMIGNALEYVMQIALRVDLIELAGFNKTVNDRCTLAAAVRSEEQIIASPGTDSTNGTLRDIIVYLQ